MTRTFQVTKRKQVRGTTTWLRIGTIELQENGTGTLQLNMLEGEFVLVQKGLECLPPVTAVAEEPVTYESTFRPTPPVRTPHNRRGPCLCAACDPETARSEREAAESWARRLERREERAAQDRTLDGAGN